MTFNVIEHQFVTQSVKDSKSNMITANGKPHGAGNIRDLESETPDEKGNISETVLTTKGKPSSVAKTVGSDTLQGPSPGDDGDNPPPPPSHPPLPKEGNDEKDLKGVSDNLRDAPPVQSPEGEKNRGRRRRTLIPIPKSLSHLQYPRRSMTSLSNQTWS